MLYLVRGTHHHRIRASPTQPPTPPLHLLAAQIFSGVLITAHVAMVLVVLAQGLIMFLGWEDPRESKKRPPRSSSSSNNNTLGKTLTKATAVVGPSDGRSRDRGEERKQKAPVRFSTDGLRRPRGHRQDNFDIGGFYEDLDDDDAYDEQGAPGEDEPTSNFNPLFHNNEDKPPRQQPAAAVAAPAAPAAKRSFWRGSKRKKGGTSAAAAAAGIDVRESFPDTPPGTSTSAATSDLGACDEDPTPPSEAPPREQTSAGDYRRASESRPIPPTHTETPPPERLGYRARSEEERDFRRWNSGKVALINTAACSSPQSSSPQRGGGSSEEEEEQQEEQQEEQEKEQQQQKQQQQQQEEEEEAAT